MSLRILPGFVAAIAAHVALKLIGWVNQTLSFEILLFFGACVVVTFSDDAAMKKYGKKADTVPLCNRMTK